jgi:eukaryotic-like serine/threonine-protein kinase
MELRRIGEFELEHALSHTLFVAQRGGQRFLLRVTEEPRDTDPVVLQVWLTESRLAQQVEHPELGKLLDVGHADGFVYFAYEHVEQPRVVGTDVTFAEAVTIAHKLCAALGHLHDAVDPSGNPLRAVHRGVAPRAIVLGADGAVRLLDFMSLELRAQDSRWRREAFAYLSPEQARGMPVDARTDQYSLASVLWELTVGQPRFSKELSDFEILRSIADGAEPPSARRRGYPRWLEPVIMRALATDPDARFPTMTAFAEALANTAN